MGFLDLPRNTIQMLLSLQVDIAFLALSTPATASSFNGSWTSIVFTDISGVPHYDI